MNMIAKERLYLTEDKQALVREGDSRGATLYCAPGDEIPESAVELFGFKDGDIKGKIATRSDATPASAGAGEGGSKEGSPGSDKENKGGQDKSGSDKGGADKSGSGGSEDLAGQLTSIKGIGPATAKALIAAGITDAKALAGVDPERPPQVEGLPIGFDWKVAVKSASEPASGASA